MIRRGHGGPRCTMNHNIILSLSRAAHAWVLFITLLHLRHHHYNTLFLRPAHTIPFIGPDTCGARNRWLGFVWGASPGKEFLQLALFGLVEAVFEDGADGRNTGDDVNDPDFDAGELLAEWKAQRGWFTYMNHSPNTPSSSSEMLAYWMCKAMDRRWGWEGMGTCMWGLRFSWSHSRSRPLRIQKLQSYARSMGLPVAFGTERTYNKPVPNSRMSPILMWIGTLRSQKMVIG